MAFESEKKLGDQLRGTITANSPGLLDRFPVEEYIRCLDEYPSTAHYKYVGPRINDLCSRIIEKSDKKIMELYHQLVMVTLITGARDHPALLKLPDDVRQLFTINFTRILKLIEAGRAKPGYFLYPEDKFTKDLGICRLSMIPLGAQKVYTGRMSRRFLFKGGWGQFWRGLRMVLFETKGFQPIYRMHTDSRDRDLMKEFNAEGWVRFYKRTAELLKIKKNIKGVCGTSWFFDPVIKDISPELAYLRDIALKSGARIFRTATSEGTVRDALFMAPARIKLHTEGKYKPKAFIMVFPRKQLLKWAENSEAREENGEARDTREKHEPKEV
jgi:hypothetical protein